MNYSAESVNEKLHTVGICEMVRLSEEAHDLQLSKLVSMIDSAHEKQAEFVAAVFITGPSASGKTTFSMRLSKILEEAGYSAPVISIDDYYRDRDDIHRYQIESGVVPPNATTFDYECVEAFDVPFFREQMSRFLSGETVILPKYSFITGTRVKGDRRLTKKNNTIVIVEGIQAMNPVLGDDLPFSKEFNIYISPFDGFTASSGNLFIDTKQLRFIRRSLRDITSRGASVSRTMDMWTAVRAGEEKYIKPMKKYADFFFNSTLEYEILFYSSKINELLCGLNEADCLRLSKILNLDCLREFTACRDIPVPERSIFKEFYLG